MRERMPNGCLRARDSGIFWCYWKRKGVPYAASLDTREKAEASKRFRSKMEEVRTAIRDGVFEQKFGRNDDPSAVRDGDILLSGAWTRYLRAVSRPDSSRQTLEQYGYQWDRFFSWVRARHPQAKRLSQVTKGVAKDFAAALAAEVSVNTFNKYLVLLRLVFKVLGDDVQLPGNPWDGIRKKKVNGNGHGRRPFTPEELRRVFLTLNRRTEGMQLVWNDDGIESERKFPKDEGEAAGEMLTLCLLGFHTGLRMGDCCMLRWDSVDLGARRITAVPMKTSRSTGKTVIIPICQELHDRLAAVRPPAGEGCVCPTKARQYQENRSEVSKRFRTLFVQCGLRIEGDEPRHGARAVPAVGFHSFRHTWVTQSAEAGVDSITIREIVGWGSPAMERIYTHLSPEHVERQFGRRSSLTVMGGAASVGSPAGKSVAAMPDDQLAQLATLAAEELARRQSGK